MKYPLFYEHVPSIKLYDALSDFLGAIDTGAVTISYLDCVKLAGHSCPTVAGAYLMTHKGLEALYEDSIPQRGNIKVQIQQSENEAVAGVIGSVCAFIVGASSIGGFKGIQGHFSRNNLLSYNHPIGGDLKLTRLDTNQSVTLSYNPSKIPADKQMQPLMVKSLQNTATKQEKKEFAKLWQQRVEQILLSTHLHDTIITITKDN